MDHTPEQKKEKIAKEIKGILLGAAGVFILVTLVTFNSGDISSNSYSSEAVVRNLGGSFGADLSELMFQCVGLSAFLIPATLLYLAYLLLRFKEIRWKKYKFVAFSVLQITLAALFGFFVEFTAWFGQQVQTGGAIGYKSAHFLKASLGSFGAMLLLLTLLAASIMVLSRFSFVLFASWWFGSFRDRWHNYLQKRALNKELAAQDKGKPTSTVAPQIKITPPPAPTPISGSS